MRKPSYYNSMFGVKVREALDTGELNVFNVYTWIVEYNGIYDKGLEDEVRTIMEIYGREKRRR